MLWLIHEQHCPRYCFYFKGSVTVHAYFTVCLQQRWLSIPPTSSIHSCINGILSWAHSCQLLSILSLSVCLSLNLSLHVCAHASACVCLGQRPTMSIFFNHSPPYFLRPSPSLNLKLINSAGLTRKPQGLSCLCLCSTGITDAQTAMPGFYPVLWIQTQQQAFFQLSHLPSI